jgi:phage-related protein (TIGR01555 family)
MTNKRPLKAVTLAMVNARDSFKNLVANLNTGRDKQSAGDYYLVHLADTTLSTIYRTSWMGRKTVDIPAKDATRKWREWEAEAEQISLIEAEEKRLLLPQKVLLALQLSRLYGGSAIYFSIDDDDPALPLDIDTVKPASLKFITVMPKTILQAGDLDQDPISENYGMPLWYEVSSTSAGTQKIHPSRLALFTGAKTLEPQMITANDGWGDSILQAAYEAVRNADSTASNTAALVYEAKVDVLKIPDLSNIMSNPRTRTLLEQRVELSAQLKGNNGMLIVDGEEDYSQKTFNFAGLPDITRQALQAVSGAADIPITRFLGQSPAGLTSTGESDLKNYYDSVNSMQTLVVTPAMENLDKALVQSTLGGKREEITYTWSSLWQMSDEQKSKISTEAADMIAKLAGTGLFPDDELAEAAANMLVEHSILPTFEYNGPGINEEDGTLDATHIDDALPRTLYIYRKVINTPQIIKWATTQGFEKMLAPADLHVTVAYSRKPIDWTEIGEDWSSDPLGRLRLKPGSTRSLEELGDGAKVLVFASNDLKWRNESIIEAGASWDYDNYHPHITITYGDIPDDAEMYQGPIVLGPEIFEEIITGAQHQIEEVEL